MSGAKGTVTTTTSGFFLYCCTARTLTEAVRSTTSVWTSASLCRCLALESHSRNLSSHTLNRSAQYHYIIVHFCIYKHNFRIFISEKMS